MQGIRSLTVWQNGHEVSMTAGYFVTAAYLLLLKMVCILKELHLSIFNKLHNVEFTSSRITRFYLNRALQGDSSWRLRLSL